MATIAALITCHNRMVKTLACLERLSQQRLPPRMVLQVYLADDGCTDGTADAVRQRYPATTILNGDGSLFWCKGMRLAWECAAKRDPDFYLWLNDDTMLFDGAIEKLLKTWDASGSSRTIVVASCCDPISGKLTYGGQKRPSGHPARLATLTPDQASAIPCDTFQSNLLLVPRAAYQCAGLIEGFEHSMGDTDYGYRATKAGCQCVVTPGFLAACEGNHLPTYFKRGPSRIQRWRLLNDRKSLPFRSWLRFARRHGGPAWPLYWAGPYVRVLLNL